MSGLRSITLPQPAILILSLVIMGEIFIKNNITVILHLVLLQTNNPSHGIMVHDLKVLTDVQTEYIESRAHCKKTTQKAKSKKNPVRLLLLLFLLYSSFCSLLLLLPPLLFFLVVWNNSNLTF